MNDSVNKWVWNIGEIILRRKNCPSVPLCATICTWPGLILKLGLRFTVWDLIFSQHCFWGLWSSGLWCSLLGEWRLTFPMNTVLPSAHIPSNGSNHSPFNAWSHPRTPGCSHPEGYNVSGRKAIFISPLGGVCPKYLHFSRLRWNLNTSLLFRVERKR